MSGDRTDQTWARCYDESLPPGVAESAPDEAALLAELAGAGPAMEIGIGTGRVGLELVKRGVPVIGVESSAAMVEQLRGKPHGEHIQVVAGDFLEVDLALRVPLVYCVFGTIFQLATQERQLGCFRAAKNVLSEGGRFVVEAAVPNLNGFVGGERVSVDRDEDGAIKVLVVEQHQAAVQRLLTEIFVMHGDGRYDRLPTTLRYAYPDELDLMARQAGLARLERWSDWQRSPFHDDSHRHISVYG